MTIAAAVITRSTCAVAADSQLVELTPAGPVVTAVRKTASGPACVIALAGIVSTPAGRLNDALPAAASASNAHEAAQRLIDAAGAVLGGYQDAIGQLLETDDVVWEAVAAGRLEDGQTGALVLTGYWTGTHMALDVTTVIAGDNPGGDPGEGTVVVALGTPHPALRHLDVRWHDEHPSRELAAHLTRAPAPPAPQHLVNTTGGPAAALAQVVERAVTTQIEAERPTWWPSGLPVAASPVVTDAVHLG